MCFGVFLKILGDFMKTKKMRDVRTIILAAVSRRDLCYVSENEGFCFGQKTLILDLSGDRNKKYSWAVYIVYLIYLFNLVCPVRS